MLHSSHGTLSLGDSCDISHKGRLSGGKPPSPRDVFRQAGVRLVYIYSPIYRIWHTCSSVSWKMTYLNIFFHFYYHKAAETERFKKAVDMKSIHEKFPAVGILSSDVRLMDIDSDRILVWCQIIFLTTKRLNCFRLRLPMYRSVEFWWQ